MSRILYYLKNYGSYLLPDQLFQKDLSKKLASVQDSEIDYLKSRVNYYNKLEANHKLGKDAIPLSEFRLGRNNSTYFFDSYAFTRQFPSGLKIGFEFGDVTAVPEFPKIVKSRPVKDDNGNAVLMKLNRLRHFVFTKDRTPFGDKRNKLVWRGGAYQPQRIRFLEMYFGNAICDIGQTNTDRNEQWLAKRLTIEEQLNYKFILCLEGNDVASNLKWVMSSKSLAVLPAPRYETWFMEGRLIPGLHFVEIRSDYSDLEEKLNYYMKNPNEAEKIIENANLHVSQFKEDRREELISLLVLQKYFYRTGQIEFPPNKVFIQ